MALQSANFKTNDVTLFLSRSFPYAAQCFAQDMLKHGDTVPSLEVSKWFERYFPSPLGYNTFRNMECFVTQYANFTEVNN
jgi:hypothetical protein